MIDTMFDLPSSGENRFVVTGDAVREKTEGTPASELKKVG